MFDFFSTAITSQQSPHSNHLLQLQTSVSKQSAKHSILHYCFYLSSFPLQNLKLLSLKMSSSTMTVILDANVCLFQETYVEKGFQGGQEIAQLLLAWLGLLFSNVQHFSLYLVGDFNRLFSKMDQSYVDIHPQTFLEFGRGLAEAVSGSVELQTNPDSDRALVFLQLVRQQSENSPDRPILLGALSQDVRSIVEEEKREGSTERIALLETVERLTTAEANEFRKISNNRIFCDRLYCAGV